MSDIVKHVGCPTCDQSAGQPCLTKSGNQTYLHVARGIAFRNRRRTEESIVELLHDDVHNGLRAGDRLLVNEITRGARLRVLRRVSDGSVLDGVIVIYRANTWFVGFAADMEEM